MEEENAPFGVAVLHVEEELEVVHHVNQQHLVNVPGIMNINNNYYADYNLPSPCPLTGEPLLGLKRKCAMKTINTALKIMNGDGMSELVCINAFPTAGPSIAVPCRWSITLVPNADVPTVPAASHAHHNCSRAVRAINAAILHNASYVSGSLKKSGMMPFWHHAPLMAYECFLQMRACMHTGLLNGHYWAPVQYNVEDNQVLCNLNPYLE